MLTNHLNIKFTKREMECLYFIIRGKSAKIIADHLCVSRRTVEDYVNKLKIKFSVKNKYELISTAVRLGYFNVVPNRFQNKKI